MHLVAIVELRGPPDGGLVELATELGTTAYEIKLALAGGLPAVVLMASDAARARVAAEAVRRRGHRVVLVDRSHVVPNRSMTALRDFRLEATGIVPDAGSSERLPYEDVRALVRATHRRETTTTSEVKEKKLRPGMAIATGGLVLTKTTTREVTSTNVDRQQVLYLFRRSGAPPWILRERDARFATLGAALRPTSLENLGITIDRLRAACPAAPYDERLVTPRPLRGFPEGGEATDVLAHLVAESVAGDRAEEAR